MRSLKVIESVCEVYSSLLGFYRVVYVPIKSSVLASHKQSNALRIEVKSSLSLPHKRRVFFLVFRQLQQRKTHRLEEIAAAEARAPLMASTRRCPTAGMAHIRAMLRDTDTWMKHCCMQRSFMRSVNNTLVTIRDLSANSSLHCALASGAVYIVIGPVCVFCVCGGRAGRRAGDVCYHGNSKLRASIFTKLGL